MRALNTSSGIQVSRNKCAPGEAAYNQIMNTIKGLARGLLRRRGVFSSALAGAAVFYFTAWPPDSFGQPAVPNAPGEMLNAFHFDETNTWLSFRGFPAKTSSGVKGVASWQSNAVQITGASAFLQYREIAADCSKIGPKLSARS